VVGRRAVNGTAEYSPGRTAAVERINLAVLTLPAACCVYLTYRGSGVLQRMRSQGSRERHWWLVGDEPSRKFIERRSGQPDNRFTPEVLRLICRFGGPVRASDVPSATFDLLP
jgi:hypothetical protein